MTITPIYSISATATGGGRNGKVKTSDGSFDLTMATPKDMGGSGNGNNPEQLFATGYAACYLGAMRFAASQDKTLVKVPDDATVTSTVGIGARADKGFGLTVKLAVHLPGVDKAEAERVAAAGHEICPYSHATKGNITVETVVV
ncbi:MAG: organic hydroperoxide resistance protein [Aestuariivirga sp.]